MRSFLTLGCISLVTVAAFVACGDDSNGPTGAAGTAGAGGGAGAAGAAGAGGGAGSGGTSGAGGSAGSGGVAPCTGCVEIDIPFAAASQSALYQLSFAAPGLDFSNATITWRVQTTTPNAELFVHPQVQNGAGLTYAGYYNAAQTALTAANFPAGQFVDVTLSLATVPAAGGGGGVVGAADAGADGGPDGGADAGDAGAAAVPPAASAFDKSKVETVQLQVGSSAAFTGTAAAVVLVDSVTITGVTGATGATFTTGVEGLALNNYANSPTPVGTPAPVAH